MLERSRIECWLSATSSIYVKSHTLWYSHTNPSQYLLSLSFIQQSISSFWWLPFRPYFEQWGNAPGYALHSSARGMLINRFPGSTIDDYEEYISLHFDETSFWTVVTLLQSSPSQSNCAGNWLLDIFQNHIASWHALLCDSTFIAPTYLHDIGSFGHFIIVLFHISENVDDWLILL